MLSIASRALAPVAVRARLAARPKGAQLFGQTARHAAARGARFHQVVTPRCVATEVKEVEEVSKPSEPRWDLERHFAFSSARDDPSLDAELDSMESACKAFKDDYEGKLGSDLMPAIEAYAEIQKGISRCLSYVMLSSDTCLDDDDMQKRKASLMQRYYGFAGNYLTWFGLELADLPEEELSAQMESSPGLKEVASFIEETRRTAPYNLSKDVERALTVRGPFASKQQVTQFYGNEVSRLRFDLKGEDVNLELLMAKMTSSTDAAERAECLKTLNDGLKDFERIAALSLNMVSGSWHIESKERGYANLRSQRNLSNNVPDEVVDSLLDGVRTTGVDLCKRYYTLKKGILRKTQGLETFTWSDRNAAIDIGTGGSDDYTWDEAVEIVRSGYDKFSPKLASMFTEMVDDKRIDVPAQNGKRGGAYCSPAFGHGPFQLLNFTGTQRDVATLAHESGHGVHFMLSAEQGVLQYYPPLTLAETASIFGEMIVFRDLLEKAPTEEDRLAMLMAKCDDIINAVVRQCGFDEFERKIHEQRAAGALSPEDMCVAWEKCVREYYGEEGEVFDTYDDVSHLWSYVSHFHNSPFYVYSYAFADLVVGSLYGAYMAEKEGFEEKLVDLLRAGGTRGFVEALAPFGLDPSEDTFWSTALDAHLGGLLEEAEELAKKLGYA